MSMKVGFDIERLPMVHSNSLIKDYYSHHLVAFWPITASTLAW